MTPEELLQEYEEDDRLARIQALRYDIREHAGLELPDGRAGIERWLETHRAVLTRKLREAAGAYGGEGAGENRPEGGQEGE